MFFLLGRVVALVLAVQGPADPTPAEIEQEVLVNVKHQPLADGTVEDLALPEEFLRRVADRIVRSSYEERYRIVVRDPSAGAPASDSETPTWRRGPVLLALALVVAGLAWILLARRRTRAAA